MCANRQHDNCRDKGVKFPAHKTVKALKNDEYALPEMLKRKNTGTLAGAYILSLSPESV
jgi:hypothetical protein